MYIKYIGVDPISVSLDDINTLVMYPSGKYHIPEHVYNEIMAYNATDIEIVSTQSLLTGVSTNYVCDNCGYICQCTELLTIHLNSNPLHTCRQVISLTALEGKNSSVGIHRTDGTFKQITVNNEDTIVIV